jgi:phosphopantothenoylcysteine decarboxylase / phosphopantothenate---cysteine ligase
VCPAMHTEMWEHAATRANVATLTDRGVDVIGPSSGVLMGGDVGAGRVVEPEEALAAVEAALARSRRTGPASITALPSAGPTASIGPGGDLAGRTLVVSAGGTREPLDPVRYLGNRSTGKMGFAVAAAAAARGATVHLVAANVHLDTPPGVARHDVTTALDLRDAVLGLVDDADVVVKAAAVADFRPADVASSKIKKADGIPTVELTRNPDVLAELGERRRGSADPSRPLLVGFAAETDDPETRGWDKLRRKGADLLVVNDVSRSDAGFATDTNDVVILGADGSRTAVPLSTKAAVADRILDEVVARLHGPDPTKDAR